MIQLTSKWCINTVVGKEETKENKERKVY